VGVGTVAPPLDGPPVEADPLEAPVDTPEAVALVGGVALPVPDPPGLDPVQAASPVTKPATTTPMAIEVSRAVPGMQS
jgi:hypothetical protein